MEHYLMMDIETWFDSKKGLKIPTNEEGKPLELDRWSLVKKKKNQANVKVIVTLQCGLAFD